MKRILIIPDIHLKHAEAEAIVQDTPHEVAIFLGDYFDDFGDSVAQNKFTAEWLKRSLAIPNRIHLLGNHDIHYRHDSLGCSGFTRGKYRAIRAVLSDEDFGKLKLYHYDEESNTLFTHAGFSVRLLPDCGKGANARVVQAVMEMGIATSKKEPVAKSWIYAAGVARGGYRPCGGPTWCDLSEFRPVIGVNQVFGHTPGEEVRWCVESEVWSEGNPPRDPPHNVCLDTHLRHLAVLRGGKLTVHETGVESL